MSEHGGLTSSKHQEHSCEFYRRGSTIRHLAYGATREDILAHLAHAFEGRDWEDQWVVMPTRTIPMGLSNQWVRGPCGLDREYRMV